MAEVGSMTIAVLAIRVESCSYTRGLDAVLVQYRAADRRAGGPFAKSQLWHTTQTYLTSLIPAAERDARPWGDGEVDAGLLAMLAEWGVTARVVDHTYRAPRVREPYTPASAGGPVIVVGNAATMRATSAPIAASPTVVEVAAAIAEQDSTESTNHDEGSSS